MAHQPRPTRRGIPAVASRFRAEPHVNATVMTANYQTVTADAKILEVAADP